MTSTLFDDGSRGATLSEDRCYRYDLWRRWDDGPLLAWIMLNPSTGDAEVDDATLRRCMGFARRDGYAGIVVRNLFAYRSTKPASLRLADDPVGPDNDTWLEQLAGDRFGVAQVVAAWGAGAGLQRLLPARLRLVQDLFGDRLVRLASEPPGPAAPHPLYIGGQTPFQAYRGAQT